MAHSSLRAQQGSASVEFALVAAVFFTLLFGALEWGRVFFVWNAAQEVTRRAARDAALMGFNATSTIQLDAVLQSAPAWGGTSFPGVNEITNLSVAVHYMGGSFGALTVVSNPPASAALNAANCAQGLNPCVLAVQAQLCQPASNPCAPISLLPFTMLEGMASFALPVSTVTRPLEAAGNS
jgi:hypothetical protein